MITRHGNYPSILPWLFPRPETGSELNFPVRHPLTMYEKHEYIRTIHEPRLGDVSYPVKSFMYGFPKLHKQATKAQICAYIGRVVSHSLGYHVYVPLFHCMLYAHAQGLWFDDLPSHCRDKFHFYDECLRQALTSSSAGLADCDLTRHLVTQTSGYQIIWRLASIAGHPSLQSGTPAVTMPRQSSKMSFTEYMDNWQHFLQLQFVLGINYNELYFLERFFDRCHSAFNNTLKPLFLSLIRDVPLNQRVPVHFTPDRLLDHIQDKGYHIGLSTIQLDSTPDDFRSSGSSSRRPRDSSTSPTKDMRQLGSSHNTSSAYVDVRELQDLPDDIFLQVCSLVAASALTKTCDLCGAQDHLLSSCKILHKIINDPVKTRRLLHNLEQAVKNRGGSTTPSSTTCPRDSRTKPMRTLDTDTDDDTVQQSLTDNEGNDTDTSSASNFP